MGFGLLNALMLAGLVAVVVPPIIHLLSRRRFDIVDWAAMQFLHISQRTRRKVFLEELLLMLLRMGLIALMVLALAGPTLTSAAFGRLSARLGAGAGRDVVLVFDGSYSMGFVAPGRPTAYEAAKQWADTFLGGLAPGDGVAVLQAKQQVVPVVNLLSRDREQVRAAVQNLPPVRGGVDWPAAVQAATKLLADSNRRREIIVLTDNQRYGWADDSAALRWELLAGQLNTVGRTPPIRVINVDPLRPAEAVNWSLAPLQASRAVAAAGQQVTFRTALRLQGATDGAPPRRVNLAVDGKPAGDLTPSTGRVENGRIPLSFKHRFAAAGSHLVTAAIEDDALPGDNRQDFALEVVPALPVLIVDSDPRPSPKTRGSDFLRDALAPARDPTPSVLAKVVAAPAFDSALLTRDLGPPGSVPRVLILSNVARLTPEQQEGVERFLNEGGGVLATLGERVESGFYNDQLYRGGSGWLPARLVEPVGDETDAARAARPLASSFFHPAVEIFREAAIGGLADARLPRYWKLSTREGSASTAVTLLTGNEPFLVERPVGKGRAILCCVPLDNSWRTNLPDLPAFAPLAHELVYYLAGARAADANVQPGQPLVYRPPGDELPGALQVQPPDGPAKSLSASAWPFAYDDTREPGVYKLATAAGRVRFYVVQPDVRESDLTPNTDADREKVKRLLPTLAYATADEAGAEEQAPPPAPQELWWLCMLGVIGLLGCELWMTRRALAA